jgi:hypothetical protein
LGAKPNDNNWGAGDLLVHGFLEIHQFGDRDNHCIFAVVVPAD